MTKPETPTLQPGASPARASPQVHDADAFERLYAASPGFKDVVWSAFRTHAPQLVAELGSAVRAEDDPEVMRRAHSLRGNAGMVAAPALEQLALELEQAAAAADRSRYAPLLALIEGGMSQVLSIGTPGPAAGRP